MQFLDELPMHAPRQGIRGAFQPGQRAVVHTDEYEARVGFQGGHALHVPVVDQQFQIMHLRQLLDGHAMLQRGGHQGNRYQQ